MADSPAAYWVLLAIFLNYICQIVSVQGLECYRCINVTVAEHDVSVLPSSLASVMASHSNPHCAYMVEDTDSQDTVQCPEDSQTYYCGYIHADITTFVRKVGQIDLTVHIRDCFRVEENQQPGCYSEASDISRNLTPLLPSNMLAMRPSGKACFCDQTKCIATNTIDESEEAPCPTDNWTMGHICVERWVFVVLSADAGLLVLLSITAFSYCVFPKCRKHLTNSTMEYGISLGERTKKKLSLPDIMR